MFSAASFRDDDPGPRIAWLREHLHALERLPLPGGGRTVERLSGLAALGAIDGSLARLGEGHLDALAILVELGATPTGASLRGVWAARPELLHARSVNGRWHLSGVKPWASGAAGLDRALMTATTQDGEVLLFDVEVAALAFDDDWHPIGMRASDSRTACVDTIVDQPVGPPGCYTSRPGFSHGGIGVAACWHGLARRIATDLGAWATERDSELPGVVAGRAAALLAGSASLLGAAGRLVDDRPDDSGAARGWASTVRTAVEHAAREVLQTSAAVQGAAALCFSPDHARAIADLTVYLGQFHSTSDPAAVPPDDLEWWTA
jgi:alkylation response protein AidB-like acyl-CoA dehydrogenase